jgi:hypothetical protein
VRRVTAAWAACALLASSLGACSEHAEAPLDRAMEADGADDRGAEPPIGARRAAQATTLEALQRLQGAKDLRVEGIAVERPAEDAPDSLRVFVVFTDAARCKAPRRCRAIVETDRSGLTLRTLRISAGEAD